MLFVIIQERLFKFRQLEKVIFFFDALRDATAFRTSRSRRGVANIHFVGDAIISFVVAFVNVTVILNLTEEMLDGVGVAGFGGSNKKGDTQTHFFPEVAILSRHAIDEINWRFVVILRGALDFLAVFVGAGQEEHIETAHLFVARDRIRGDGGVRVTEMRPCVYVVNWSSDVILRFVGRHFLYFDLLVPDTALNLLPLVQLAGAPS